MAVLVILSQTTGTFIQRILQNHPQGQGYLRIDILTVDIRGTIMDTVMTRKISLDQIKDPGPQKAHRRTPPIPALRLATEVTLNVERNQT